MKKPDFLHRLAGEKKLELVEVSPEISSAYLQKGSDCLRSAKVLMENELYDNSVSLSYYAMYNSLTALLFSVGIKCENHVGSISLLDKLFKKPELYGMILLAKKERIDKQYYVTSASNLESNAAMAKQTASEAEEFILGIRLLIGELTAEKIENYRSEFRALIEQKESSKP